MPYSKQDLARVWGDGIAPLPPIPADFRFDFGQPLVAPPSPVAPDPAQIRASALAAIDQTARTEAATPGRQFLPMVGWYTPGGSNYIDRLGTAASLALETINPFSDPMSRGANFLENTGLPQFRGATAVSPSGQLQGEILNPAAQRMQGGLMSAAGGVGQFLGLPADNPLSDLGAQTLAANRAIEQQKQERDRRLFGETGGYFAGQARGAAQSVAASTAALIPGVGTAGLIGLQAGSAGGEAVEEAQRAGMEKRQAVLYGLAVGAIEGGVTALFQKIAPGLEGGLRPVTKELARDIARRTTRGLARDVVKNVLGEQAEEQLITASQSTLKAAVGLDEHVKGLRTADELRTWAVDSLVPAMRDTFVQTLIASGPFAGVQAVQQRSDARQMVDLEDRQIAARGRATVRESRDQQLADQEVSHFTEFLGDQRAEFDRQDRVLADQKAAELRAAAENYLATAKLSRSQLERLAAPGQDLSSRKDFTRIVGKKNALDSLDLRRTVIDLARERLAPGVVPPGAYGPFTQDAGLSLEAGQPLVAPGQPQPQPPPVAPGQPTKSIRNLFDPPQPAQPGPLPAQGNSGPPRSQPPNPGAQPPPPAPVDNGPVGELRDDPALEDAIADASGRVQSADGKRSVTVESYGGRVVIRDGGQYLFRDGKLRTFPSIEDAYETARTYLDGPRAQPTQPQPTQPGPQAFETAQGSRYVFRDGKTIRLKSPHAGHDPKDVGLKEESTATVFVSPEAAREIGMWNTMEASGKRIVREGGRLTLVSPNPRTGEMGRDGQIEIVSETPREGLAPVELFNELSDRKGWFRGNHPGNAITKFRDAAEIEREFQAARTAETDPPRIVVSAEDAPRPGGTLEGMPPREARQAAAELVRTLRPSEVIARTRAVHDQIAPERAATLDFDTINRRNLTSLRSRIHPALTPDQQAASQALLDAALVDQKWATAAKYLDWIAEHAPGSKAHAAARELLEHELFRAEVAELPDARRRGQLRAEQPTRPEPKPADPVVGQADEPDAPPAERPELTEEIIQHKGDRRTLKLTDPAGHSMRADVEPFAAGGYAIYEASGFVTQPGAAGAVKTWPTAEAALAEARKLLAQSFDTTDDKRKSSGQRQPEVAVEPGTHVLYADAEGVVRVATVAADNGDHIVTTSGRRLNRDEYTVRGRTPAASPLADALRDPLDSFRKALGMSDQEFKAAELRSQDEAAKELRAAYRGMKTRKARRFLQDELHPDQTAEQWEAVAEELERPPSLSGRTAEELEASPAPAGEFDTTPEDPRLREAVRAKADELRQAHGDQAAAVARQRAAEFRELARTQPDPKQQRAARLDAIRQAALRREAALRERAQESRPAQKPAQPPLNAEHFDEWAKAHEGELILQPPPRAGKPAPPNPLATKEPTRQPALFPGADALPGQRDLFDPFTGGVSADVRQKGPGIARIDELHVDPERFQYKLNVSEEGVTDQFADVKTFNPDFAGTIHVWHDPGDGKTYVVNGHHRYELAKRSNYTGDVQVYYIDAPDAASARAFGALVNIANGHGTAIDAAKYLRDSGAQLGALEDQGLSVKGKVAADAILLARLSPRLFDRLTQGLYPENRALALARWLEKPEDQELLVRQIDKREESGKELTLGHIEELARQMHLAARETKSTKTLFGEEEEDVSLFIERADVLSGMRRRITEQLNAFKAVATDKKAGTLATTGNVLTVAENRSEAQRLAQLLADFDRETRLSGPISELLNQAASDLARKPRQRTQIINDTLDKFLALAKPSTTHMAPIRPDRPPAGVQPHSVRTDGRPAAPIDFKLVRAPYALMKRLPELAEALTGRRPPTMVIGQPVKGSRAHYETKSEAAVAASGDFDSLCHEVGHHLVKQGFLSSIRSDQVLAEMRQEGFVLYGFTPPSAGYEAEGFCELFRMAICNPSVAAQRLPSAYAWLMTEISGRPGAGRFAQLVKHAAEWSGSEPAARALGRIRLDSQEQRAWIERLKEKWLAFRVRFHDNLATLGDLTKAANRLRRQDDRPPLERLADPRERARFVQGATSAVAHRFHSLYLAAWAPLSGRGQDVHDLFGVYMWARRTRAFEAQDRERAEAIQKAAELYAQTKEPRDKLALEALPAPRHYDTGLNRDDAAEILADLERRFPEFRPVAEATYGVHDQLNQYARSLSPTLAEKLDRIEDSDPGDYLPLGRLFPGLSEAYQQARARAHGTNSDALAARITHELRGSVRTIKPPLEQLFEDAADRVEMAHRRHVLEAVLLLAAPSGPAATDGLAPWIRELPEAPLRVEPSHESVVVNGQTHWYQLTPALMDALQNASRSEAKIFRAAIDRVWIFKLIERVTTAAKHGFTTFNPAFTFFGDPIQNTAGFLFKSSEWNPARQVAGLLTAYGHAMKTGLTGKPTREFRQFLTETGLDTTVPFAHSRKAVDRIRRAALKGRGWAESRGLYLAKDALDYYLGLGASIQAAPFLAEGRLIARRLGVTDLDRATPAQRMAIVNGMKALMPYAEKGSYLTVADRFSPFLSIVPTSIKSIAETVQRQPGLSGLRAGGMILGAMALYAVLSQEDWWQELPPEARFGGIVIPGQDGQPAGYLPFNSHETQVLIGLPMAVMAALEDGDTRGFAVVSRAILGNVTGKLPPLGREIIKQGANIRDLDTNRALAEKPPAVDNWNDDTTEFARWLGQSLGVAPTRIDSAVRELTGGLATKVLRSHDILTGARRGELADVPVIGGTVKRGTMNTLRAQGWKDKLYDLQAAYDQVPEADRARETERERKIRTSLHSATAAMSDLAALARNAATVEARDRWDAQAAEIAKRVVEAAEAGRPSPWVGRLAGQLDKQRRRLGAR